MCLSARCRCRLSSLCRTCRLSAYRFSACCISVCGSDCLWCSSDCLRCSSHRTHGKTQKPNGLKLSESTEWPTLREARIHRNECSLAAFCGNYKQGDTRTRTLRHHIRQPCLTSAMLHKQSILCLLSYDAQRLYALCIPKA